MTRKPLVILFVLLAFCSCSKNDFKVWKNLNADVIATVQNDSADYRTSPSGVLYKEVYPVYHTGYTPKPESYVRVNYTGWLVDGTQFDSGKDAEFLVGNLVQGWQEILCMMIDGQKWRIYIPYNLAYGDAGSVGSDGNFRIPPYSTLIFDLELVEVLNN